ncbi:MAG TPA: asparagine synthase (glutamine-hydrolyzing) [Steroidobacteraceae bacterium]|nr:asparagine synthase (glutamine-hydrolyzing) [Steroidobacteraceae bacterium]
MASGTSRLGRARLPAMCGIAGIIGSRASVEIARSMAQRLRHRGPDGEGVWGEPGAALAHRRLAILDLSECGHQPMLFDSQVLSYNGEIYNHERLRAELPGPWRSSGDTEVLVHLLAKHGSACLDRLVGMFAFAAWDRAERRLLLVRDRLGIKPLYYQLLPDGIAFASELKALLVLGRPEIDHSAVRDYLFHGYIPAPKTIYQGIAKLPAGHTLTWAEGRIRIERYWNPPTAILERSAGDTVSELDALLRDVVPAHTLSDVPVGVFLSGGIDSALTTYYLDTPRTYTLGFDSGVRSETEAARRAAAHLHTEHLEMTAPLADFEEALGRMSALFDEPFGDSAAWSNYLIAQFARREVTVALSGEGGDEIFCGYPRYWSRVGARSNIFNRSLARCLPPLSRLASSMQRHAYAGLPAYAAALGGLTAQQIDVLLTKRWREPQYDYLWFYRQFWREDLSPLAQLRWLDLNTDLAEGLLTKVDRTSMAHSLEVRPPLLDHRLVEFMLSVDPQVLIDQRRRRGKLLVRQLMEPRLPPGHLDQPKSGFGLPVHRWLRRHPQVLRDAVRRLMERGVLQVEVGSEFRRAWYLLVLDRWFTAFG